MNALSMMLLALALAKSENPLSLEDALSRTGKSVERFWTQFASVNCTESVVQKKIGKEGKVLYEHDSSYDYLILLNLQGEDLSVEESRLLQKESGNSRNLPLLLTSGFSTLQLIFHSYYQGSFEYQRLEDDTVDDKKLMRIAFHHVRGTRSTTAVRLRGRDYPLDLEGTAWIDARNGMIEKITANLMSPMDDLNLRSLQTSVQYAPQHFPSIEEAFWLPVEASIDVETARQHWRNTHRFSNYRHFTVKTESTVAK